MIIGDMEIRLRADIARLQRDMDDARRVVGNTTAAIGRAADMAKAALSGIAGAAGLAKIAEMSDAYTKLTGQLRLATDGSRAYGQAYADVKRIANSAQADLGATGALYASLTRATKELGVSQRTVADITEAVNLGFKISGAGAQETQGALIQLSQAFASGALRGDEFNSVNEAAPRLMQAIADSIGKPVGALRGMAEQGKLTAEVVATALPKALGQLRSEADQVQTIAGAFTVLKNNVVEFTGVQAQSSGAVTAATGTIGLLANNLSLVGGAIATVIAVKFGNWLANAAEQATNAVRANTALRASTLAAAQADALATTQASLLANERLAEARAATLAASGATQIALATNALVPAQARATAAAAAQEASMLGLAAAQRAATIGSRALNAALSLTGGPLGLIITALGVAATAWGWYQSKQAEANAAAAADTKKSAYEIMGDLDKQIEKLKLRAQLAKQGAAGQDLAAQGGEAADMAAEYLVKINDLKAKGAALTAGEQIDLINYQGLYDAIVQRAKALSTVKADSAANDSEALLSIRQRLTGVNQQYLDDLAKLQAAYEKGGIGQKEYTEAVSKLATETYKNSTAGKESADATEMTIAAMKRRDQVAEVLTQREIARVAAVRAAGGMNEVDAINATAKAELAAFDRKAALAVREMALTKAGTKERADLEGEAAELREQRRNRELQQQYDLQAVERRARDELAKFNQDYSAGLEATSKILEKMVTDAQEEAEQNEETARTYGLSKAEIERLTVARLEDQLAQRASLGLTLDEIEALEKVIAAKKRTAVALGNMEEVDAQKKVWESIEQTAHDTFISIFDSGKSAFDRLRDALKNGLLDLLYQMTLKKWIISLQADVTGGVLSSAASAAGSAAGGGSSLSSAAGLANTASNLYKMVTGGFAGISDMVAGGVQSAMSAMGYTPMASQGLATASGQALTPLAAQAGQLAGAGAGGFAGYALNKTISGGYEVSSGLNTISTIAGTVASYFNPLFGAAIGAITGVINRAFGRKAPEIQSQGVRGTYGADGSVTGETYQNIIEKGGWFRSDKRYTNTQALTEEMQSQIGQSFKAITDASSVMAKSLGLGADSLVGYSKAFDVTLTSDAAKNQEALTAFFGGVADEVASKLVPSLASFSQSGETASETLQRLAGEFDATTAAVQNIGKTAVQAFGDAGIASAAARERLVQLAGGTSALTSLTGSYAQNFLTEAERLAPVSKALDEALSTLSLSSIPTTRSEFAKLVSGLDLTNEAQAKQFVSLMQLNDAFALVHPETATKALEERQKLQDELDEATMSSSELLAKQRAAVDESNRALFDQVQAAQAAKRAIETQNSLLELQGQIAEITSDKAGAAEVLEKQHAAALAELDPALRGATEKLWALQKAAKATEQVKADAATLLSGVDSAFSALQQAVDREKTAVQTSVDAHSAAATRLQSLSEALHGAFDGMQSPEQQAAARAAGQAQIRAALAAARAGGSLPDANSLKDALAAVQQDASDQFSNRTDYLRDLYKTQNDIGALAGITDDQLSVEQKALQAAQDQLKSLDGLLAREQALIDEAKGQSTTLLSIDQGVAAVALALKVAQANPVVASTPAITKAYQDALGRAPDAAGLSFWQGQAAAGTSTSAIVDGITGSAEAKNRAAIQQLYKDLLGRQADDAGLGFFASSGASLAEIAAAIKRSDEYKANVPGYANGGDFAGGVRLVGEVGPEIETTGASRIHSTQSLIDALRNPSDNSAVLAAAVERLTATVERQERALEQIQRNTRRQADTIDVVTEGGKAMRTKEQAT